MEFYYVHKLRRKTKRELPVRRINFLVRRKCLCKSDRVTESHRFRSWLVSIQIRGLSYTLSKSITER